MTSPPAPHPASSSWPNAYVGLPYEWRGRTREGCDCWGLIRIVYAELLGIELPSYAGEQPDASEREEIAAMVAGEKGGWISCSTPRPFDLALFKIRGQVTHAGIVVTPELFLQNTRLRARASTIERFDHPFWRPKFEGFYRHPTLSE